ncbi:YciI family protein [Corallococcus sp. H22C18031201]|uniref:YciI family protein n=1 Tax=Citreicoccus inhibens TaxID=2849499 RepID=UPI000E71D9B8|nr:YciI family protein [Citreicoccus inhibens]MBU8895101.1 YciI family protein [Citreicoccus inhibens]RJS27248.1 YciI family protein [Corallococcus sp. H22C18031201]
MKYLLMIYENEKGWMELPPAEAGQLLAEYGAFTASLKKSGNFIAGHGLQPTATATTVSIRDGKRLTTDGPFAETREQLGGFYLVDAKNIDEAVAIASRIPGARAGRIEVRPVAEFDNTPD